MIDPVFVYVETCCSVKRGRSVVLSLRVPESSIGKLVTGFAVDCDCKADCSQGIQCLLGKRITTGRNQK